MILDNKSTRRFEKLYTSFITYANDRLDLIDDVLDDYGRLDFDESYTVAVEAFDTNKDQGLVADYIRDNPDKLSRTDLREIGQFEHAIAGTFVVLREGRDVVFLVPGFKIAVRGFTCEIDTLLEEGTPALAETILLPFESTIVFALVIESYTGILELLEPETFEALKAGSRTIRSARDLIRYESAIEEAVKVVDDTFFDTDDDYELDEEHLADDELDGQHRGSLAGLRGKERILAKERMEDKSDQLLNTITFDFNLKYSSPDMPPATFRELYLAADTSTLEELAEAKGITSDATSMDKEDLVDALLPHITPTAEKLLRILRGRGPHELALAREIFEAGGQLKICRQNVNEHARVTMEASPVFFNRAVGDTIVATMMDEVKAILAGTDWDAETEAAERLDAAKHYFETLVELRGVDVLDEALEEYRAYVGDPKQMADEDDLIAMLRYNGYEGYTEFFAYDIDGTTMLANAYLMNLGDAIVDTESIRRIIQLQADKPKRPLTPDMLVYDTLSTWVEQEVTEVQDLVGYLDEHVPDGKSDLVFADDLCDSILFEAQMPTKTHDYTFCMRQCDFYVSRAQVEHLEDLIIEAVNHQPCWINRGWSPTEMKGMMDRGEWTPQGK